MSHCLNCGKETGPLTVARGVCRICRQDVLVIVGILTALADAADTPSRGLPSGHLYAVLMRVTDLGHYQAVLATLKSAGFVEERGHYLTATEKGVALGRELDAELKARDPNCASCGASMVLEHECPNRVK